MSEIIAATAAEVLEGVASAGSQAAGQSFADWAADEAFKRVVDQTTPGYAEPPIYKWNYDPAADEAFSRLVDETSADGAWQAWKDGGGNVSPGGSAAPSPTVKASPQTAIKKAGAAGASAGGLLSMSLPTWVAAAAPLIGVAVGAGLYELSPELWTKISQTLLPWAYEDSEAMPVVTDEDGNTYLDKDAVEALKNLFEEEGIGPDGYEHVTPPVGETYRYIRNIGDIAANSTCRNSATGTGRYYEFEVVGGEAIPIFIRPWADNSVMTWVVSRISGASYTFRYRSIYSPAPGKTEGDWTSWATVSVTANERVTLKDGTRGYVGEGNIGGTYPFEWVGPIIWSLSENTSSSKAELADIILRGTIAADEYYPEGTAKWGGNTVDVGSLPITKVYTDPADDTKTRDFIPVALPTQPGVSVDSTTNPDPTTNSQPEQQISPYILPTIPKEQYPEGSDDESLDKNAPIPMPFPSPQPQPKPDADTSKPSDEPPQRLVDIIPPLDRGGADYPNMPVGGDPLNVDGGVGGLVSVYNPTYSELQAFSQWLWVTYADATIDKIWNNPFDGIISLHEFYATPNKGDRKYIKSGFLVSPVNCITIPNRYSEINCGSAIVPEYYGNYLDYSPYSKALCYLPFIGIVELNVDDIVGHAINITYRVDSYSGACIALISCAKEGSSAVLYQFSGNCSVQMPIAGGTQAAIKAAQLSAGAYQNAYHIAGVTGLVGGIASGAAQIVGGLASMAGSAMGTGGIGQVGGGVASIIQGAGQKMTQEAFGNAAAVSQTVSAKSSVQHSGQFGESFGAMGAKRPYLIIKRPVQVVVPNYQDEYGYPAHKYVTIGSCTGYLRCRGVHVVSARATDDEIQLIEQELMGGVFVT